MKNIVLTPNVLSKECIVQYSESYKIDKHIYLTVPVGYKGYVYINEKLSFRVDPCTEVSLIKEYGKEFIGDNVKVCFILTSSLPVLAWGFGNLEIKNDSLHQIYKAGAHGNYTLEIDDIGRLINSFSGFKSVTIDDLKEKSISVIRSLGAPVLNSILTSKDVSIFNASLKVIELKDQITKVIASDNTLKLLGLKVNNITVDGIHINEDDLERIKSELA